MDYENDGFDYATRDALSFENKSLETISMQLCLDLMFGRN